MKGQTLRYLTVILGLLLCAASCFAQDKTRAERTAILLNDAGSIPSDFTKLGKRLNFKYWDPACNADGIETSKDSIKTFTASLKEAQYMAETVQAGAGWSLPQVAQVSYVLSVGVPLAMVLSRTAHCTGQNNLSNDFVLLGLRLVDSADNAHSFEMILIHEEEDIIDNLTPKKQNAPAVFRASV